MSTNYENEVTEAEREAATLDAREIAETRAAMDAAWIAECREGYLPPLNGDCIEFPKFAAGVGSDKFDESDDILF